MDPIKEGKDIFRKIVDDVGDNPILAPRDMEVFFEKLLDKTKGWVIVDFLDAGGWDKIENFEIDHKYKLLTLTWHDYRGLIEDPDHKAARQIVFPAAWYSLCIRVNSVVPVKIGGTYVFLINGFAMTEKEVKKKWGMNTETYEVNQEHFFGLEVYRKVNAEWEVIHCHTTPLFSIAILPKNIRLGSFDSKNILYWKNLDESLSRISRVHNSIDLANGNDEICEKANTIRRILEYVLKIECCYKNITPKKEYSQLMLGDLIREVSGSKNEWERKELNQLVRDLNTHSHDAGMPVDKTKVKESAQNVISYIKKLDYIIKD